MNSILAASTGSSADARKDDYQELKARIHQELLNRLNLERLNRVAREEAEPQIRELIVEMIGNETRTTPLSLTERESLVGDVLNELFGLGPLEALLRDADISDILVNRFDQVYIERNGRLEETDIVFKDNRHLLRIIERIVNSVGRRIDESSPMVDARLKDGSRVNAIVPPLSLLGPVLSIRRFGVRLDSDDLIANGTMPQEMLALLQAAVEARISLVVSGGTGSGKTTLLNVLSKFIPSDERLVTIEDVSERKQRAEELRRTNDALVRSNLDLQRFAQLFRI
jgi:pilus assembly protein CpaF